VSVISYPDIISDNFYSISKRKMGPINGEFDFACCYVFTRECKWFVVDQLFSDPKLLSGIANLLSGKVVKQAVL